MRDNKQTHRKNQLGRRRGERQTMVVSSDSHRRRVLMNCNGDRVMLDIDSS